MEESSKKNVYNLIVLDESGSMGSLYEQALSGINETISGIRQNQEQYPEQRHFVSIVTFEGYGIRGVKTRRDRVPVENVHLLKEEDYHPGGCTPLYDAMGESLGRLSVHCTDQDAVCVTVITDGMENSSEEYSQRTIREMVGSLREKGWTFTYIGANQNAVETAQKMDIRNAINYDADKEGFECMSLKIKENNKKYASVLHDDPLFAKDYSFGNEDLRRSRMPAFPEPPKPDEKKKPLFGKSVTILSTGEDRSLLDVLRKGLDAIGKGNTND